MEIINLSGVGPKLSKSFQKIGISNTDDLLNYYPYRYNFYKISNINNELTDRDIIEAIVESNPVVNYIKKTLNRVSFRANSSNLIINVTIFNRAFIKNNLSIGKKIYLIGKYNKEKNLFLASDIKFNLPENLIEPVYHLTSGVNNNLINKLLKQTLNETINEYIPEYLNEKYNFITKKDAVQYIHFPNNVEEIKKAKIKLIYEELFIFMFKILFSKRLNETAEKSEKLFDREKVTNLINDLNFKLTEDQNNAVSEILDDLKSSKKMNRLLIGDVGSGKTIVGEIAMYANYLAGFQSAFMAPTEVLAIQHYHNFQKLLGELKVELLIGSMTKKEKENVIKRLKENDIDLIVGTHTLIEDSVTFNNLGLIITDEQHRFGVMQRKNFLNKGNKPDALFMSATPIPRTYALALYGDLDVSMIKTKPNGRKEIFTKVVKEKDLKIVLTEIYEELKKEHQIFVVSPLIEDNDNLDLTSVNKLKEKFEEAFQHKCRIAILHGKMSSNEKQAIMNDFKNKKIHILISTTVIEVGVDIENATMMVIFNTERFGLATIHQLRGRVGRNDLDCKCYLICNQEIERLKVLEESNDGFYISEKDFELRKEGDLFGTKQSGYMIFKIANLYQDAKILFQAKKDCEEFIKNGKYTEYKYYNDIIKEITYLD